MREVCGARVHGAERRSRRGGKRGGRAGGPSGAERGDPWAGGHPRWGAEVPLNRSLGVYLLPGTLVCILHRTGSPGVFPHPQPLGYRSPHRNPALTGAGAPQPPRNVGTIRYPTAGSRFGIPRADATRSGRVPPKLRSLLALENLLNCNSCCPTKALSAGTFPVRSHRHPLPCPLLSPPFSAGYPRGSIPGSRPSWPEVRVACLCRRRKEGGEVGLGSSRSRAQGFAGSPARRGAPGGLPFSLHPRLFSLSFFPPCSWQRNWQQLPDGGI